MMNPLLITAYRQLETFGLYRTQWSEISDGPGIQVLSLNGTLKKNKMYGGGTIMHDKLGLWDQVSAYGNFAYQLKINQNIHISFGVSFGGLQRSFEFQRAKVKDKNDPNLSENILTKNSFDGAAGITFTWTTLKVGVSSYQILGTDIQYKESTKDIFYGLNRYFKFNIQYTYVVNDAIGIHVTPLIVTQYVAGFNEFTLSSPFQFDINLITDFQKYGWILAAYKSNYAIVTGIGVHVNNAFHIGFSYDFSIFTDAKQYIGQTGELIMRYTFNAKSSKPQFLY